MRILFEKWYGWHYNTYALESWKGTHYSDTDVQLAWDAWQEAWHQRALLEPGVQVYGR